MNRDQIYSLPLGQVGDFAFDDKVADVFTDMIARSVPGYRSILSLIEQLAGKYVSGTSCVYDLGCSLGAATFLIRKLIPPTARIVAVDNSQAMMDRFQAELSRVEAGERAAGLDRCGVEPILGDIESINIEHASLAILNFTLQFIAATRREELLQKIFDGMLPQGALVLSEKICFPLPDEQNLLSELHHDFKRANGYSDLEIAQKRTALENQLIPETLETHLSRLRGVGFRVVVPWFQCFNFVSILAIKVE